MKDDVKEVVRSVLTDYIETNHCRKTPERFAVLDAAYSLGGFFRTEDLVEELAQRNFHVSRGTLFNSLRLFVELRLLIRHRFQNGTRYEACYKNESHCHQICTVSMRQGHRRGHTRHFRPPAGRQDAPLP